MRAGPSPEVRAEVSRRLLGDLVRTLMLRGMNDDQIAVVCDFIEQTGEEMRLRYEAIREVE